MSETLTFVPIICSKPLHVIDAKLKLLVEADIDCYVDEKKQIVVNPDQWTEAMEAIK